MTQITRKSRRTVLALVAGLVWLAVGATFFQTVQLAARAPMTVLLNATPKAVKVKVGNKYLFGGDYRQTPVEISLPPGPHKLRIIRDGFITHEITVHGSAGEKLPIDTVLERRPDKAIGPVYFDHSDQDDPIYIEMDDGLATGTTPFTVEGLLVGADYDLTVFPEWPNKKDASRCRFRMEDAEGHDVEFGRLKSGKVKFEGCRALRRIRKDSK